MAGMSTPLAYFITMHAHGTWLHGQDKGSVDRTHNLPGTEFLPPDEHLHHMESEAMHSPPMLLETHHRHLIDKVFRQVIAHRKWTLHALHVRTTHVHVVVTAPFPVEKVMGDLKAWATRRLREAGIVPRAAEVWARHGSTRYLWSDAQLADKIDYVMNGQGPALA